MSEPFELTRPLARRFFRGSTDFEIGMVIVQANWSNKLEVYHKIATIAQETLAVVAAFAFARRHPLRVGFDCRFA